MDSEDPVRTLIILLVAMLMLRFWRQVLMILIATIVVVFAVGAADIWTALDR